MIIRAIVLTCALAVLAAAVNVTGAWKVDAESSNGTQYKLDLLLKEEGGKLSGTLTTDSGEVLELRDVKLEAEELSFKLDTDDGTYSVALKVSENAMKGSYTGPSGETGTVTATR